MSPRSITQQGYSFTLAPLAVKNLVIVGVSGGEYGIRGFIDAYDADTGQAQMALLHRPRTRRAGPRNLGRRFVEDRRRAGVDHRRLRSARTNQLFWPTGNPSPSNRGEGRAGDNLYSNTLLALDADTGKLKWHFQFTKHDEHDWDATQVPVMIDPGDKHLIVQANRNGFFYVIDRTTGKLLSANPYAKVTWSDSKDAEGRPVAEQPKLTDARRRTGVPRRARRDQLDVAHLRSANRTLLRDRARAVRHLQHRAAALRRRPCLLRQRLFSRPIKRNRTGARCARSIPQPAR